MRMLLICGGLAVLLGVHSIGGGTVGETRRDHCVSARWQRQASVVEVRCGDCDVRAERARGDAIEVLARTQTGDASTELRVAEHDGRVAVSALSRGHLAVEIWVPAGTLLRAMNARGSIDTLDLADRPEPEL